ncbi:MAG: helix-turn-helix transcriptional regulator [Clostridia bacterium]|nr:helix-turn-helix transcriptional regulator [Clostridia bacterium]
MKFEQFGLNVAKERQKQNLSAYELSLRLGKDASYVSKLENGKINISLKMMIAISELLNIPITNLFKD